MQRIFLPGMVVAILAGVGCQHKPKAQQSTPPPPKQASAPIIVDFTAEPSIVAAGGRVRLRWKTADATTVEILPDIGAREPEGEVEATPARSQAYTLIAKGAGGTTQRVVEVTVTTPGPPLNPVPAPAATETPSPAAPAREREKKGTEAPAQKLSLPRGDYYVCRFTQSQAARFTHSLRAYERVSQVMRNFLTGRGRSEEQIAQALATVNRHLPEDLRGMLKDLTDTRIVSSAESAVLGNAMSNALGFEPEQDMAPIGCSQSVLTYDEVRHMFGRAMANEYLAVQVNVRNLSSENEFLLHDSQVALYESTEGCDPLDPLCGPNFSASREKVLARNLQTNTNWSSPRNAIVSLASAVASLGSSIGTLTGGPAWRDAFTLLTGTAVPLLRSGLPDLSVNQLRLTDDMVFSSSSAYHVVVPKRGTVPFVVLLPLRNYVGLTASRYRSLAPGEQLKLARRLFAVISGVHIAEVARPVGLSKITCPANEGGSLDLGKTADAGQKQFTCQLEGTSLNLAAKVRLRNAKESTDAVTVEGGIQVTGGSTTAGTVVFPDVDALRKLAGGEYAVALVLPSGQESLTSATLSIAPKLTDAALTIDLSKCSTDCEVEIKGYNLGLLKPEAKLKGDKEIPGKLLPGVNGLSRKATFAKTELAPSAGKSLDLILASDTGSISGPKVQVTQPLAMTALQCPADGGALDLRKNSDAAGTKFSCAVTGTALNAAAKIRLRNAADPKDAATVDGSLSLDAGSTEKGTATFDLAALRKLGKPKYTVLLVTNDQEIAAKEPVTIAPRVEPPAIPFELSKCGATTCEIELKGYNLGLLKNAIALKSGDLSISGDLPETSDPLTRKAVFKKASLTGKAGAYDVQLASDAGAVAAPKVTLK